MKHVVVESFKNYYVPSGMDDINITKMVTMLSNIELII